MLPCPPPQLPPVRENRRPTKATRRWPLEASRDESLRSDAVRLYSGAALGAAPDTTIIPRLALGLNPSFQCRFSPEGGRKVFLVTRRHLKLPTRPVYPPRVTQVCSGGLQSALRYPSSDNEAVSSEPASLLFPKREFKTDKTGLPCLTPVGARSSSLLHRQVHPI